jgi:Protein of unknown function (DUF3489)
MNRAAQLAQKRTPTNMTNVETTTPAPVAEQGAHVVPGKATSKKQAAANNGAPKARKSAQGAKSKKYARKTAKAAKQEAGPRTGSKSANVVALVARTNGATLAELMKATGWQAHSVRGFLSTASSKRGLTIQSLKNGKGERVYRVKK